MIIPTYNEVENIPLIIKRIFKVMEANGIEGEVLVVDDDSKDGTAAAARKMAKKYPVRTIVRKKNRGLSPAVIRGFKEAKYDVVGVIDADLSHPPEVIPDMLNPILKGEMDFTLGSRYVEGGGMDNWPLKRQIISGGATMMAYPLHKIKDPMSGYFMVRKSLLKGVHLNPKGYKIALEVLVKCNIKRYKEVPIIFKDRQYGESKLNWKEQVNYLIHLQRLYKHKYTTLYQLFFFLLIGGIGMAPDIALFNLFYHGLHFSSMDYGLIFTGYQIAHIIGFTVAVTQNFFLNKAFTFDAKGNATMQYVKFFIVGFTAYVFRSIMMYVFVDQLDVWATVAQIVVIILAVAINFLGSKFWAFAVKKK